MRSTILSAALVASLITPAMAQTSAAPGTVPAYPPPGGAPAYPQTGAAPAYPPAGAAPAYPQAGSASAYPQPSTAVPPGANPATGARPGNDIGTGMSLPTGNSASNIDQQDTRSAIAPNLPSPQLGPDASPVDYLRAAQSALSAGQTGEAQQALEQAQTRLLDRTVPYGQTNNPSDNPAVAQITQALHALAAGNQAQCMQLIQSAIPAAQAMAR